MTLELDPENTRIEFTLAATLHTVHGTFAVKSGTIHFNPSYGAAGGLVVADAASGDTGNTGRDQQNAPGKSWKASATPRLLSRPPECSASSNLRETRRCRLMAFSDCMEATT
jgi:hypothetical protein